MKSVWIAAAGLAAGLCLLQTATAKDFGPAPSPQGDVKMVSQAAVNYCTNMYNQCYQASGDSYGCQAQYQQCLDYYRNSDPYGNKPLPPEVSAPNSTGK